jgi:hypothetical protein
MATQIGLAIVFLGEDHSLFYDELSINYERFHTFPH